jgi:hypothetical protein
MSAEQTPTLTTTATGGDKLLPGGLFKIQARLTQK